MIMINTTVGQVKVGQRVKLAHMKQLWECKEAATKSNGYTACFQRRTRRVWYSRGWKVQVPLEDDSVLGGAKLP